MGNKRRKRRKRRRWRGRTWNEVENEKGRKQKKGEWKMTRGGRGVRKEVIGKKKKYQIKGEKREVWRRGDGKEGR